MMNFRTLSAASKGRLLLRYFTESTPEAIHPPGVDAAGRQLESGERLTSYYTGRDSRGTWRPDMGPEIADALGIDRHHAPREADLVRLFEGRRADTGEAWSKHKREISAYDVVFSVHKSITLAAEFAQTPAESAAIWHAIDRSVDTAMRYLAGELGWARRGAGGLDGADAGEVAWVSFRHHTARPSLHLQDGPDGATYDFEAPIAGDPHAHIHNALFNLVATPEGRVGSLDTRRLRNRVHEFGAFFQALLADELRELGAGVALDEGGQAAILPAIPDEANKTFSKRERQILREAKAYAATQGLDWEGMSAEDKLKLTQEAGAAGRLGKMAAEERSIWRDQAEKIGWQHQTVLDGMTHARPGDDARLDRAYDIAAMAIAAEFETAAVIGHDRLRVQAARSLISTGVASHEDIDAIVRRLEERGVELRGERVRLIIGTFGDEVQVTNTAQVRIELDLAARAREAAEDRTGALATATLREAIGRAGVAFSQEQQAAIWALGQGGALTMLTGVAGAGKTTLLAPLVAAWEADRRFGAGGRQVIGSAVAWRQADALQEAGIGRTWALDPLLRAIDDETVRPTAATVLVLDEVSQIGPRSVLRLLELQARTGMTIKMLGDREQAQAIEAGDTVEMLRRALPASAMPELLSTVRQQSARGREIAGLFREAKADVALAMKREDGTAMLAGGDYDQVVEQVADLYIRRRDVLRQAGGKTSITVSALTNEEVGDISRAIRQRLRERGEISGQEVTALAIDQRGETYTLPIAQGDRLRLFRRTMGRESDGRLQPIGNNGDVVEVVGHDAAGLKLRNAKGRVLDVAWDRITDEKSGRLLLGFGHALTVDAAQGTTSTEHINALAKGTAGATAFKGYVAESRARGATWTVISEAAVLEAERRRRALGDVTPITRTDLWQRAAGDLSQKPYKTPGVDVLLRLRDRKQATKAMLEGSHAIEMARLDAGRGREAVLRSRAAALAPGSVSALLGRVQDMMRGGPLLPPEAPIIGPRAGRSAGVGPSSLW